MFSALCAVCICTIALTLLLCQQHPKARTHIAGVATTCLAAGFWHHGAVVVGVVSATGKLLADASGQHTAQANAHTRAGSDLYALLHWRQPERACSSRRCDTLLELITFAAPSTPPPLPLDDLLFALPAATLPAAIDRHPL